MSSIPKAKAEAQKLIKRYNELQVAVKTAVTAEEAARKANEAKKVVLQISSLQSAITKTHAKEQASLVAINAERTKLEAVEKSAIERINTLEKAQERTRLQIQQLNRTKTEVSQLKQQAQKSAKAIKTRRTSDENLQQKLTKLIKEKESEQLSIKQELNTIRQQSKKNVNLLKIQRDAARALIKEQEQEQSLALSNFHSSKKGLWMGISIGIIVTLILTASLILYLFILEKPLAITTSKSTVKPAPVELQETVSTPLVIEEPEIEQTTNEPLITFRDTLKNGGKGPMMVKLPKGTFMMGSKNSLPYHDERPQHEITLESFAIAKYEITFEEYDEFAEATGNPKPRDEGWGRKQRPVINISWYEANEYVRWLSSQTGYRYNLPSEREWEYAAGAGAKTIYWWGYEFGNNRANCGVCGSQWDGKQTAPVGSFAPNAFGLHDVIGNVKEWTISCFRYSYRGSPSTGRHWQGGDCKKRVARSSSFKDYQKRELRTTKRHNFTLSVRTSTLGFRVVRID